MDYRIAVCDDREEDRAFACDCVTRWAQARGVAVEIHPFSSGDAFLFQYAQDKSWDILLLDVEMPGCSGVEVARQLRQEGQALQIVFLTGYSDYLAEGYEVWALHYLLKPVQPGKLYQVLDRAVECLHREGASLLLELPDQLVRLPLRQVEYIEVRGNYVTVHTARQSYTVKKPLSAIQRELDDRFYRVGRSYILNLSKVRRATKKEALLVGGASVPLPRGAYEALNQAIIRQL